MLKRIFFIVVDILNMFKPIDWSIIQMKKFGETSIYKFFYNGKVFTYVGDKLPGSLGRGFCIPIKSAKWNGADVTEYVKTFAGPRQDFYNKMPDLSAMFYQVVESKWIPKLRVVRGNGIRLELTFLEDKKIEPLEGKLEVTNLMGQTKIYDSVNLRGKIELHVTEVSN